MLFIAGKRRAQSSQWLLHSRVETNVPAAFTLAGIGSNAIGNDHTQPELAHDKALLQKEGF